MKTDLRQAINPMISSLLKENEGIAGHVCPVSPTSNDLANKTGRNSTSLFTMILIWPLKVALTGITEFILVAQPFRPSWRQT